MSRCLVRWAIAGNHGFHHTLSRFSYHLPVTARYTHVRLIDPFLLSWRGATRCGLSALLAAVILSGAARADEETAIKLVEKLGGKITRDDTQPVSEIAVTLWLNERTVPRILEHARPPDPPSSS
jgi:hypothetical protein